MIDQHSSSSAFTFESKFAQATKRALDVGVSGTSLLLLSPLFLIIAAVIKLWDGGRVFYPHKRIGKNGRSFHCLKFRSMAPNADMALQKLLSCDPSARAQWERSQKLTNDPRITAPGKFLRNSSLDELPQLINILQGEMSLVGPRPITTQELHFYGPHVDEYLSVKPGLTGLWQVSGRSDRTFSERVDLDLQYVSNRSLWFDLVILVKTIPAVLSRRGSY